MGGSAKADGSYELGHGYDVGPFNFAGYGEVRASVPDEGPKALAVEDFSLFVTGHVTSFFNPFVEAELAHVDIVHSGRSDNDRGDGSFALERLYDDADLTDSLTFRLGKMLAPVGEWNQIHAAPLVLATVRPAVTYQNFSQYLTGVSLLYSDPDGETPGIQVYWQPYEEFSESPSSLATDQYKRVAGLHVSFPLSGLDQIGLSFQKAGDTRGVRQSLLGLDFQYRLQKLTLQGEGSYADLSGGGPSLVRHAEWGGYLSGSYAFTDRWSAYSWYEQFSDRTVATTARDLLFGVAYRPLPAMPIKLEYVQNLGGQPVNPTGVFASWSVLF